jgi:CheY-like chemotaxis protein/anti-sigma regulatory factor (Ser/Thr protein kinase)
MSHELRTPLHAILGYSQMLGADPSLPEAARARLKIVGASGHHLLRLINEVLDLSKIEAGKLELRPAPFDLPALLAAVAAAHEARAAAKGLAFRRSDPSGLPNYALGDAAKLRQVLENLLGNAIKFTVRGEVRLLALSAAAGTVRFEVSDTGPGIPPADLARLFQPFTQLAPAAGALAAEGGTGLGLAIAQRLAALMGGSLHVSSVVGQGSRFWFELPLSAAERPEAAKPPAPRITGYEGPRRRVLAVDDVEANRRLFVDLLAPLGFEVADAASAAETLARLETFRPDLVLLDLRLPDLDGFSLARRLRADPRLEGVKILAASASVFNQDPAEALAAGCDGFIAKPFLPDDFFARLAELLGLAWRTVAEAAPRAGEPLDPALLALLRSAAEAGDIVAMSEAFGQLKERQPGAAALEPIAEAIAAFDTAGVARLTEPPRPARE